MNKRIILVSIFLISLTLFLTANVYANNPPNATITNITGYENMNITFTLPATDSDGDNLTYSSDNPNITWNGTHLYYEADYDTVLHPELIKTITVNITADDIQLTYTQEVNITIIDVNRAPYYTLTQPPYDSCNISRDQHTEIDEDSAIEWQNCYNMSIITHDPDGDDIIYWTHSFLTTAVSPLSLFDEDVCQLMFDENNTFWYRVLENYVGWCYFKINFSDIYGLGNSNASNIAFRIDSTNPTEDIPPDLNIPNKIFYENELADLGVYTKDFDGESMNYTTPNDPRFTWDGTKLFWNPTYDEIEHPDLSLNFSVNVTGTDGTTSVSQIVNITLLDVNRAPYYTLTQPPYGSCNISDTGSHTEIDEDSAIEWQNCYNMSIITHDPDGDDIIYWNHSFSTNAVAPLSLFDEQVCQYKFDENNTFWYRVLENYVGWCHMYINFSDIYGLGNSNASNIVFRIDSTNPTNDAPFIRYQLPIVILNEDEYNNTWNPISYFADYESDSIFFSILNSTNINSDNITWNFTSNTENWFGEQNLTLTATDNIEDMIVNITVRILPVNDAPTLESSVLNTTFDEDTIKQINFSTYFSDVDNTTLMYTLSGNTELSIDSVTGNLVNLTATANWNGEETITIHANDSEFEATDTFTITIDPVNDAPTIDTITNIKASERDKILLTPTATDIDDDPITYYTNHSNLIWNTTSSSFEWTPIYNQSGNYTVNVTVSDGTINDSTLTTIEVTDKYHRDDISLKQGWNLISYPYTLDNTSVADMMSGIISNYTIWAYNSSTQIWSEYDSNKESHLNNLTDIRNTDSFWINISEDENLTVIGTRPENITINLNPGWNLISYPLDISNQINTTLSSIDGKYTILWKYDESTGWDLYNPIELSASTMGNFMPESGYWINMTESATLTFSY